MIANHKTIYLALYRVFNIEHNPDTDKFVNLFVICNDSDYQILVEIDPGNLMFTQEKSADIPDAIKWQLDLCMCDGRKLGYLTDSYLMQITRQPLNFLMHISLAM